MNPASLAAFPVVVELPVVWGEMDSYGHVNNAVYFRYFESGRVEYFRRMGWFDYQQQCGIGPILAAIEARFRRALTYPDRVSVGARMVAETADRFIMEHLIISHSQGQVVTEGRGEIVPFHYAQGTKTPITDELRCMVEQLESTSAKERPAQG
jgi:acyl-CoA thioester hydrolase